MLTDTNALTFLIAGLIISLLVGSLIYLLGTSRSRAVKMVHERTDQLQFRPSTTRLPDSPTERSSSIDSTR